MFDFGVWSGSASLALRKPRPTASFAERESSRHGFREFEYVDPIPHVRIDSS
jgi:hypothetical protein